MTNADGSGPATDVHSGARASGEEALAGAPVGEVIEAQGAAEATQHVEGATSGGARVRERVGKGYITLVTLAILGAYIALVTPVAISLALKVEQLAPDNPAALGVVTGIGAVVALIGTPVVGMISDRTRSPLGRRRPYIIGGMILGVVALLLLASAPNLIVLTGAWVLAQLGWGVGVLATLQYSQADRLPEEQRGRVSGLVGFVQNLGPVVGAGIASAFIGQDLLVFMVPGAIAIVFVTIFVLFVKESADPSLINSEKLSVSKFFGNLVFSPRKYPDFAWNCVGRVIFNLGLSFSTTFTTFFFASRMGVNVADIGGVIVVLSLGGIVAGAIGALGGGWLSDKIKRRRLLVLVSSLLFTAGVLTMAFGSDLSVLIAGSVITTLGVGVFMSVDQAIVFDVLPERDTDAGRFIGINGYATLLPQAVGPLIASVLLVIGASGGENYLLLFLVAAACTIVGGLVVFFRVKGTS